MRTLLASTLVMVSLAGALQSAAAQTSGTAPFCLKGATGLSCTYATMAQCEEARGSQSSDQCITRSDAGGTTGLGDTTPRASPNSLVIVPERRPEGR